MSQEILKISLGRFGVKDNWNDRIAILVVRYKATYLILYPLLANILNQSKDIAPASPPPINPTHALLGENPTNISAIKVQTTRVDNLLSHDRIRQFAQALPTIRTKQQEVQ